MAVAQASAYDDTVTLAPIVRWSALRRLLRKKIAFIAIVYLVIFYGAGIFAPVIPGIDPYDQELTTEAVNQGPSAEHWFGTDAFGRDLFSRVIYASRTTIIFTVAVVVTGGLFLGVGLGLLAGYRGGWVDTLIMRVGEAMGGLPPLSIILALTAAFRTRVDDLVFWLQDHTWMSRNDARLLVKFLIITGASVPFAWIGTSRIVRGQALALRENEFVTAAEMMGASTSRIVTRHILPGVMPLVMVGLSGAMAGIAGTEVALSFLGLGIDPPTPSFGNLIADGAGVRAFAANPHILLATAIPLILFSFAWNLLGDALVDILEPRTHSR
jgi:ABC-type dipeptide/oligopeptide/nickel transport system permease subunit